MSPRLRKFTLTAHVACSVGWLGAAVAYVALAVAAVSGGDVAAYPSMELVGWFVIVPLSLAAVLTGLVQALGTEWGLLRHYWIIAKVALTGVASVILLLHMPAVSRMAELIAASPDAVESPVPLLVHAAGGVVVLFAITALSIFKPWGRTRLGRKAPAG